MKTIIMMFSASCMLLLNKAALAQGSTIHGTTQQAILQPAWLIKGNTGTNATTDFLGTKDAQPLVFKVNDKRSGLIDYASRKANTSFGFLSLNTNTGSSNTAIGFAALKNNTSGFKNTSLGWNALKVNTTGHQNTAVGASALNASTTSLGNTAIGAQALLTHQTGDNNTAVGVNTLFKDNTGSFNTALGGEALFSNLSSTANTAAGAKSLYANTTGYENTAVGYVSLFNNTSGFYNVAVGGYALNSNMAGYYNTAIGHQALKSNRGTASFNTAIGSASMQYNMSGQYNTSMGFLSLYTNELGNDNTAIGHNALHFSNGDYNSAFGDSSFFYNFSGNRNTGLGALSGAEVQGLTNATAIGFNAKVDASNKVHIGNDEVTSIGGAVGWTNFLDARIITRVKDEVPGLRFINALHPITYHIDVRKEYKLAGKHSLNKIADSALSNAFTGLSVQDVEAAAKKINYNFSGIDKTGKIWGLRYGDFVAPLIKAVQELSQENEALKARLSKIEALLNLQNKQNGMISQRNVAQSIDSANTDQLEQYVPNPYSTGTTIAYYLPAYTREATVNFYSSKGIILKSVKVTGARNGTLQFHAGELPAGVYYYTLFVDGVRVDTKQMIQIK